MQTQVSAYLLCVYYWLGCVAKNNFQILWTSQFINSNTCHFCNWFLCPIIWWDIMSSFDVFFLGLLECVVSGTQEHPMHEILDLMCKLRSFTCMFAPEELVGTFWRTFHCNFSSCHFFGLQPSLLDSCFRKFKWCIRVPWPHLASWSYFTEHCSVLHLPWRLTRKDLGDEQLTGCIQSYLGDD